MVFSFIFSQSCEDLSQSLLTPDSGSQVWLEPGRVGLFSDPLFLDFEITTQLGADDVESQRALDEVIATQVGCICMVI